MESQKMYCPSRCRYRTYHCVAANYPVSERVVQGQEWRYAKLRPSQSPRYRVCTKAMIISKGSYGHGDSKNIVPKSVQIPYLPLRGCKLPRFMEGSIGPRMEICETSALSIPMVPRLLKSNCYIKGSNGHGEFKNVLPQSVKIPCLLLRGSKVPRFMGGSIEPRMEICESSALPIPMLPRLHQSNGYINRKLRAWRVQKCIPLVGADTLLTTAWPQTTPFHGVQYREQNGNIRNFDPTNPNGTAFAPKQWLYQKEATGMESSQMYRPSRLRYRTHHCVEEKYPVLWEVVESQELKQEKLRPYQSPWYRVCTKAMVL